MRGRWAAIVLGAATVLSCVALFGRQADAYLHFGVGTVAGRGPYKWRSFPIRYQVSTRPLPNVSAQQFQSVVQSGFDRWREASGAPISANFLGFVSGLEPPITDGQSLVAIQDLPPGVLGITYLLATVQGDLFDADVGITASQPWSTNPSGEPGRFDLRATVTHELGHLLGLGHSALGETTLVGTGRRVVAAEAIMFPIAFLPGSAARPLGRDDIAGLSELYPPSDFRQRTGSISGRVRKDGRGVFGAHVVAFDPASTALVGVFTLSAEGDFTISGLEPGPKVLRVEPLDDAAVGSFFGGTVAPVDAAFSAAFAPEIVFVQPGQATPPVTIEVRR